MKEAEKNAAANHAKLALCLFGAPQIVLNGNPVSGLRSKEKALLFYLAITRQPHLRSSLASLFWGESPEKSARTNLRKALHGLREALPDHLDDDQKSVALKQGEGLWIDVGAFEEKVARATQNDVDTAQASRLLNEAIDLYQGDLLSGFLVRNADEYEAWQSAQQERLRAMLIVALQQTSQHWIEQHDVAQAIRATRRILELEPWREESHRELMELFIYDGQRHSALVQYEICRQQLENELDVPPSPQTVQLYQQIRDGEYEIGQGSERMSLAKAEATTPSRTPSQPTVSPSSHLFGIDSARNELLAHLQTADRPWLCAIDGIGGIGKTSLAQEVATLLRSSAQVERVLWVSAKQEEFQPGKGIQSIDGAALDAEAMLDGLLRQIAEENPAADVVLSTKAEKQALLLPLLKEQPTLLVIDNLETVADYEAVVPTLHELTNPSKVLITSRRSLAHDADIFSLTLGELSEANAFALLRHEANMRGIRGLIDASEADLAQITKVVGGHPLALNLVLGQLNFMPLGQVLVDLQQATGQRVDDFYTYIYWQAWHALTEQARRLFLAMPMLYNATFSQQGTITQLDKADLQSALAQLIGLSLVQIAGDLYEPRYRLHRLTETFLMNEVVKWQALKSFDPTAADQEESSPNDASPNNTGSSNSGSGNIAPQFVAGPPIMQPHLFFGRNEELTRLFGWWQKEPLAHVALIGPRRCGKTSLLVHLQSIVTADQSSLRPEQKQDWLPTPERIRWVDVNFQDPRWSSQERLLRHLLTGFGFDAPEGCSLETFMDIACAQPWERPAIVLMDELAAGLGAPELDQKFWWTLRALTQATNGYLAFVVAAHDQPLHLAEDQGKTSPFFNLFTTIKLGPFTQHDALDLITSSPVPFAETDTDWIIEQSGRWPYLLQICCQERLAALEAGTDGDAWKETALERMEPFSYLKDDE